MPLTLSAIDRLLPPELPQYPSPDQFRARIDKIEAGINSPLARGFLWSLYLMSVYAEYNQNIWKHFKVAGSWGKSDAPVLPSVGFFPVDPSIYRDARQVFSNVVFETGYFFGMALYDMRARIEAIEPLTLLKLYSGYAIHVMQFPAAYIPHAPLDPANAASTSWAEDQLGTGGVLTCKHAVAGLQQSANVHMKDGTWGKLIKFGDGAVDAALIETSCKIPLGLARLGIESHPINGSTVTVEFRSGSISNAQILNSWYFADNSNDYNSMRVFIDHWGQQGDSGTLVSTAQGDGVAIYTGSIKGNGTTQGICQYLKQAVDKLNLTLFA